MKSGNVICRNFLSFVCAILFIFYASDETRASTFERCLIEAKVLKVLETPSDTKNPNLETLVKLQVLDSSKYDSASETGVCSIKIGSIHAVSVSIAANFDLHSFSNGTKLKVAYYDYVGMGPEGLVTIVEWKLMEILEK